MKKVESEALRIQITDLRSNASDWQRQGRTDPPTPRALTSLHSAEPPGAETQHLLLGWCAPETGPGPGEAASTHSTPAPP